MTYVPSKPTKGWLFSECERLGVRWFLPNGFSVGLRGSDVTRAQMVRWLNAGGYALDSTGTEAENEKAER